MIVRDDSIFYKDAPQKTFHDFVAEMESAGLVINGTFKTNQFVRVHDSFKTNKNKAGWYVFKTDGDVSFGAYGSWIVGSIGTKKWCSIAPRDFTPTQKRNFEQFQERAHKEQEERYQKAATMAAEILDTCQPADPNHKYLRKKQIGAHGIAQDEKGNLIIPVWGDGGELQTIQRIAETGFKTFMQDGKAKGGFYPFGSQTDRVLIAEGFATAATLYEATGLHTFCAFNAGNIPSVTKMVRGMYPKADITICADNDESGAGVEFANKAAKENSNVKVIYPVFGQDSLIRAKELNIKPNDFNDLFLIDGKEAVLSYVFPKKAAKEGLYYIKATDIEPSLEAKDFVQGVLMDGALSVVYGESNCGKTFFMTDLAFHVALGKQWRDRRVTQGGVVYVALEGASGLKNRVAAFKKHHGEIPSNFAVVPCHVDFMDPQGNITEFVDLIEQAKEELGNIKLVVIDTLARAMAGGDENSGQDMGMLVKHADMIRSKTGAHVSFVHHSGKDKAKGARGHSALRAAIDTEIEIDRDKDATYSKASIVKQRDGDKGDDVAFSLKQIILGQNQYQEDVTSCVVVDHEVEEKVKGRTQLTDLQQFVYDSLLFAIDGAGQSRNLGQEYGQQRCVSYEELREALEHRGFKEVADGDKAKSITNGVRVALKKKRYINFNKNYIWIVQ